MKKYFKCFISIMKHKYYVFKYGITTHTNIFNLITHDLSKFSLKEFPYYSDKFYGDNSNPAAFKQAWNHHRYTNKHHYDYWGNEIMPKKYIREMIADWLAASRVYSGTEVTSINSWVWWNNEKDKIKTKVHPKTWDDINKIMEKYVQK